MQFRSKRVLWVDDDASTFLSPLMRRITKSGLNLDVATTFDEAEKLLKDESYSAVLIDIILPSEEAAMLGSNLGITLARRIRTGYYFNSQASCGTNSTIPLVVLSVVRHDEIAEELSNLNMEYFDKTMLLESNFYERLISALSATQEAE